jgi:ribosomal protein S12 methylthiotransferase accessory factor
MQMVTRFPGGARVDTEYGPYVVRTDQPRQAGGEGNAPTPFATFLASIGACAGTYVLAFCRKRALPTDGIQIVQTMDSDRTTGMITGVHLAIQVPSEFPEKYRNALIHAVEQCTVKRHLEATPALAITTQVEVSQEGAAYETHPY